MWQALTRVTTVELACMSAGSLQWAHSLERLWFELLDERVAKGLRGQMGRDARGYCFLGARKRARK